MGIAHRVAQGQAQPAPKERFRGVRERQSTSLNPFLGTVLLFGILGIASFLDVPRLERLMYYVKFGILLLMFGVAILFVVGRRSTKLSKRTLIFVAIVSFWTLMSVGGLARAPRVVEAVAYIIGNFLLGLCAFVLMPELIRTERDEAKWHMVWMVALAVGLVGGIINGVWGGGILAYTNPGSGRFRYVLGFNNPNTLGLFSWLGFVACLRIFVLRRDKTLWLLALAFIVLIRLSDSRTSLGAAIIVWLLVISLEKFPRLTSGLRLTAVPIAGIIILALLVVPLLIYVSDEESEIYRTVDRLTSYRLAIWFALLRSLEGWDWAVGKGIGVSLEELGVTASVFDNSYIRQLMETGMLGFSGLVSLLGFVVIRAMTLSRIRDRAFAIGLLTAWMAVGWFESPLFTTGNPVSVYVWLTLGTITGYRGVDCLPSSCFAVRPVRMFARPGRAEP